MSNPIHLEAVERILSAVYATGDHCLSSFFYGRPGAPRWEKTFGAEIFVRRKDYIRALLFVRENGAAYLRAISISDLWSMVANFITENFWYVHGGRLVPPNDRPYAELTTIENKRALADALAISTLFEPKSDLTLYPLLPIRVGENFESENFFLLDAADLSMSQLPPWFKASDIEPRQFPPITTWDGRKYITTSWLGIRSPLPLVSQKMASAVLGAIALTPLPRERYLFSMRTMLGGRCTMANSCSISNVESPHTPPLMHDILLTKADHGWLAVLDRLLSATDKKSRSYLRALEYFYRAWFLEPCERFPALCMSLDSLVGADSRHTAAAVEFVKKTIDYSINEDRLRLLMRVRGAVIHGAAPDVYDSEHYQSYYVNYETDPIFDLELIVAKCSRKAIFGEKLVYHADPNAQLRAELLAKGKLPAGFDDSRVIPEDV